MFSIFTSKHALKIHLCIHQVSEATTNVPETCLPVQIAHKTNATQTARPNTAIVHSYTTQDIFQIYSSALERYFTAQHPTDATYKLILTPRGSVDSIVTFAFFNILTPRSKPFNDNIGFTSQLLRIDGSTRIAGSRIFRIYFHYGK